MYRWIKIITHFESLFAELAESHEPAARLVHVTFLSGSLLSTCVAEKN